VPLYWLGAIVTDQSRRLIAPKKTVQGQHVKCSAPSSPVADHKSKHKMPANDSLTEPTSHVLFQKTRRKHFLGLAFMPWRLVLLFLNWGVEAISFEFLGPS
jgi:hypothetical protein